MLQMTETLPAKSSGWWTLRIHCSTPQEADSVASLALETGLLTQDALVVTVESACDIRSPMEWSLSNLIASALSGFGYDMISGTTQSMPLARHYWEREWIWNGIQFQPVVVEERKYM